jgi:putative membrane protein
MAPPPELEMVSRRHIARSLVRLVPVAAAIIAASIYDPRFLLLAGLLPFLAIGAALGRRFHRYALHDGMIFIQRGVWRQNLWIIPVRNVQATSLSRSRPQRWLGLASLAIDTAGAPMTAGARIVDLREDLGRALAAAISAARRA